MLEMIFCRFRAHLLGCLLAPQSVPCSLGSHLALDRSWNFGGFRNISQRCGAVLSAPFGLFRVSQGVFLAFQGLALSVPLGEPDVLNTNDLNSSQTALDPLCFQIPDSRNQLLLWLGGGYEHQAL